MDTTKVPKIRIIAKLPNKPEVGQDAPPQTNAQQNPAKIVIKEAKRATEIEAADNASKQVFTEEPPEKPLGLRVHEVQPDYKPIRVSGGSKTDKSVDFDLSSSDEQSRRPVLYAVTEDSQ